MDTTSPPNIVLRSHEDTSLYLLHHSFTVLKPQALISTSRLEYFYCYSLVPTCLAWNSLVPSSGYFFLISLTLLKALIPFSNLTPRYQILLMLVSLLFFLSLRNEVSVIALPLKSTYHCLPYFWNDLQCTPQSVENSSGRASRQVNSWRLRASEPRYTTTGDLESTAALNKKFPFYQIWFNDLKFSCKATSLYLSMEPNWKHF